MGFDKLIFDKDNTLTYDQDPFFASYKIKQAMQRAVEAFTPEQVLVVSNMRLSSHVKQMWRYERPMKSMKFVVEDLPNGWAGRKPFNLENTKRVLRDIYKDKDFFQDTSKIIMIGDNLFTDVIFGNLNDMATVRVEPFEDPENLSIPHGLLLNTQDFLIENWWRETRRPHLKFGKKLQKEWAIPRKKPPKIDVRRPVEEGGGRIDEMDPEWVKAALA